MSAGSGTVTPASGELAVRQGMADLIQQLRQMTNAGMADYTIAGVSYWSDLQLQDILDRNVVRLNFVPLDVYPRLAGSGLTEWHEYRCKYNFFEQPGYGGTTIFMIQNTIGSVQLTSTYAADYQNGVFEFVANQMGTVMCVSGYSYDPNGAAAEIWGQKAAQYGMAYDFKTDNQQFSRSQVIDQALKMAQYYGNQARLNSVSIGRSDEMPSPYDYHRHPREVW